ncbi:MAG: acetyltransferase, partial [Deltaproteobacteria bacterium]|nr:acetyltransferase [Deltaproteobacteria bacterium]
MTEILVIGGGGHSKVLIGAIRSMKKFTIRGILDSALPAGTSVSECPVLGGDELLLRP